MASRSWWVLLLVMGPLVGVTFISAVRTYAEASGLNGTALGVGEAFAPLIGVWAPTFSACELAAAFLLPFVGIRLVAGDAQNGALKIESQHRLSAYARMGAKALVLFGGWIIASAAPLVALLLWRSYGGTIYVPEILTVVFGHFLNGGLTIALAAATAALTEHPSTAAILTLSVTVGTWILNFIAAVHGGIFERAAAYTPTAMVAAFQHGLIRLDVLLATSTLIVGGLVLAALWSRLGVPVRRRLAESMALAVVMAIAIVGSAFMHPTWDISEARSNSFPAVHENALKRISAPLRIEVHLAPEDPRRSDLEYQALAKLRRVLPHVQVDYVSATSIGLFEQTREHYGEIWYELGNRKEMSRTTTADGVLEAIYAVAEVEPPQESDEFVFRGHPLAVPPRNAALVFYGMWPAAVLAAAVVVQRRQR
jgi:ABC-2 type transport system permease protein